MRSIMVSIVFIFALQSSFCQTDSIGNWLVNVTVGLEAHDKRLFNYSEKESLREMQPEFWGTYHYGLDIQRKILGGNRMSIFLGTGISFEKATFDRPFNHFHFRRDSFYILRHQNEFKKMGFPISLSFFFKIAKRLNLLGSFQNQFIIRRSVGRDDYNKPTPYNENVLEYEGIGMNLGMVYTVNKLWIGFNSRIINYQMIDKIIFNSLIRDPRVDHKWEWSNPLRFDFTIGYMW